MWRGQKPARALTCKMRWLVMIHALSNFNEVCYSDLSEDVADLDLLLDDYHSDEEGDMSYQYRDGNDVENDSENDIVKVISV